MTTETRMRRNYMEEFKRGAVVLPETSYGTITPPTVRNDYVGRRLLEIVLSLQVSAAAPTATQGYPSPATNVCASNDNT